MITLYGFSFSPYVRKVRLVLAHKNIEYSQVMAPPSQDADFLQKSPLGKIPYLTDGDFSISDSSVIVQYLEKKYPQMPVLPQEPHSFARALWLDEYSDTKVNEIITGIFFERFGAPKFLGRDPDEAIIKSKEMQFPVIFNYLEQELKGKKFLVNECLTLADISLTSNFANFFGLGYTIDDSQWPNLARYTEKLMKIDFIKKIVDDEQEEMADF
ncbi:glutathione S-transferase family protein [Lentisphaera profundi]|uniref:Glutathione S-transferase family protein n=1 Tax=Lentisphaera profundi TaxID=1658616 RepID=A0ABY7VYS3_9BACT|nr:glutathione S-transferase family protein [Lentisphaera profundi]WDE98350.1 glutathione S-transferase family protein [Lentisphaera profundi]